jgi:hypothetical protein
VPIDLQEQRKKEKIFHGLECSLVFLLVPEIKPDDILERQAYEAAKKKVKYIAGTMALEEQLPSKKALQELLEEEKEETLGFRDHKNLGLDIGRKTPVSLLF